MPTFDVSFCSFFFAQWFIAENLKAGDGSPTSGEAYLGTADWAPDNWAPDIWAPKSGTGHLGALAWCPTFGSVRLGEFWRPIVRRRVLAPDSPGAQISGAQMSSAQTAAPNRRPQTYPTPYRTVDSRPFLFLKLSETYAIFLKLWSPLKGGEGSAICMFVQHIFFKNVAYSSEVIINQTYMYTSMFENTCYKFIQSEMIE